MNATAVIYLNTIPGGKVDGEWQRCKEVIAARNWTVLKVLHDEDGAGDPLKRDGLTEALKLIETGKAGVIVTARLSMVSPMTSERTAISARVRRAGGELVAPPLTGTPC